MIEDWQKGGVVHDNVLFKSAISCIKSEIWDSSFNEKNSSPVFSAELVIGNPIFSKVPMIYKKKIGLTSPECEIPKISELLNSICGKSCVRLDANESLTVSELHKWNEAFGNERRIQFIEQPLPRNEIDKLLLMDKELQIPLALDESLVWKKNFLFFETQGWQGFYIIKPFLFEAWDKLLNFIRSCPDRIVVSTTFESPFGYEAICRCASLSKQVAGLDRNLFKHNEHEFPNHHLNPLFPSSLSVQTLDQLWRTL